MPHLKDYTAKKSNKSAKAMAAKHSKPAKRRPGRDIESAPEEVAEDHEETTEVTHLEMVTSEQEAIQVEATGQDTANIDTSATESEIKESSTSTESFEAHQQATDEVNSEETVDPLSFPYSDLVKYRAPKAFAIAERVLNDWKKDGDFKSLPLENPLANYAVGTTLRKAKVIEKDIQNKIESHPTLSKVKEQALEKAMIAKMTIEILLKR
jgi:hypothetical protein